MYEAERLTMMLHDRGRSRESYRDIADWDWRLHCNRHAIIMKPDYT